MRLYQTISFLLVTAYNSHAAALDLNSFRAQDGRSELSVSSTLAAAAFEHANDMARRSVSRAQRSV